jgi:hypothetical protein
VKVKLDENLGSRGAEFLRKHNFDVLTVADQGLLTAPDRESSWRLRFGRSLPHHT